MESFLRIMFLRFRYGLGYESLCREIADSLAWRRFCRIPLGERVPHPSTVEKIAKRCGNRAVEELNEALLAKAHENKVVKLDKVRADTTVVEANVSYPTDSGLLAKGVAKMAAATDKLKTLGLAARTTTRGPDPFGASAGARRGGLAEAPQRRGQGRGARDHRRAGHDRRTGHC
jgi:IS5 family transposase